MNYKQLVFAREYRGYSQTQLSKKVTGLSQSNLSKFEKGIGNISDEVISRIISVLNFPATFFENEPFNISLENANFRKRSTINKAEKLDIETSIKAIGGLVDLLAGSVEWPDFDLKMIDLKVGVLLNPHTNMKLEFGLLNRKTKSLFDSNTNTTHVYIAFKTDLRNLYYDF